MAEGNKLTPQELLEQTLTRIATSGHNDAIARMRAALALNTLEDLGSERVVKECRIILHRIINGVPSTPRD